MSKTDEQQVPPEKAAREAAAQADPPSDAITIPVDRLIAEAPDFLGVTSAVAAGGLHGVTKKNLTIDEAKAAIQAWLKAPVN